MAATTIAVSSGNAQVGQFSTALADDLVVLVTDAAGAPVAGVTVTWQVGAGGGSLASATSDTDANGLASNAWTLGAELGPNVATAVVDGLAGSPVVFTATAAIVTVQACKDWLRIETTAEDDLIAQLILEAQADIEATAGQPLTQRSVTWRDNAEDLRLYESPTNLILPSIPVDEDTVVVTDGSGNLVDADQYEVRQDLGLICAKGFGSAPIPGPTVVFDAGPYTIACTAGFATGATYATVMLPQLQSLVKQYVGFLYQQRTPGARTESASGTRVEYEVDEATGLPKVIARGLRRLRGIVVGTP